MNDVKSKNKKSKKIRLFSTVMTIVLMLNMFSCTLFSFSSYAAATNIRMNISQATIQSGGQYQLSAIITPSDASKSLRWTSSNPNVATVNNNGLVTGKSSGTSTITCITTDGSNLSAFCTITVAQLITSISMQGSLEMNTGNTYRLSVSISPASATGKSLKWNSSNGNVATVSSDGTVTAKSPGTANITCVTTDGSKKSATCTVTVKQGVTGITLNKTSATIGVGNSTQLTANVSPSNATNKSVKWSSSNTGVATVNGNGQVTGVGVGTTTITCRSSDGNATASCTVTVANVSSGNSGSSGNTSGTAKPNQGNQNNSSPVSPAPSLNSSENVINENIPEDVGEITELPEEELNKAIDDIFEDDNENKSSENNGEKEYSIDTMLKPKLLQSKKENPLTISWSAVKGFSGYEIYVAIQKNKKDEISDDDYFFAGETTGSYYEIVNLEHKRAYFVKLRAYIIDEETGEKKYSDFTSPINMKIKGKGFVKTISDWFTKIY